MRKTFRNKNNFEYWTKRWTDIEADEPMINHEWYPLKYSEMIVKDKNQLILEAGCGAGRILRYYHNNNFKIIGIDFIKEAIEKLKKVDNSLDARVGNILNLDFQDNYFDCVLSFGLYHNFYGEDLYKSLRETHRVLKNGGKLCVSFRADNIQEKIVDWMRSKKNNDKKEFHKLNLKKKEFINLIEKHNFKVENVFSVQNMPFLYKFRIFRYREHKDFNENKGRKEGYKFSKFGRAIQSFLIKFFPDQFCNIFLIIASKK